MWDLDSQSTEDQIILSKVIDLDALDQTKFSKPYNGKLIVYKRFKVIPGEPERQSRSLDRAYHVNFGFDIKYKGAGQTPICVSTFRPDGDASRWLVVSKQDIGKNLFIVWNGRFARYHRQQQGGRDTSSKPVRKLSPMPLKTNPQTITFSTPPKPKPGLMRYLAVDTQYFFSRFDARRDL